MNNKDKAELAQLTKRVLSGDASDKDADRMFELRRLHDKELNLKEAVIFGKTRQLLI